MGTKLLLAGGEDKGLMRTLIKCKTRFILLSFYYIKEKWGKKGRTELFDCLKNFEYVLIDSGAFTLFSSGHNLTYAEIEKYAYEYALFLEDFKTVIDAAVELDLYSIASVGDKAHRLREDILEKSGVPICPVYHGIVKPILYKDTKKRKMEFGMEKDWEYFLNKYKYVGLASQLIYHGGTSRMSMFMNDALKKDVVVHGFGITKQNFIRSSRFFTVDSTAWTNGARFGTTYIFQLNKLLVLDYKQKQHHRRQYFPMMERAGLQLDYHRLMADKSKEVHLMNCWNWTRFQEYVYNFSNRDYWKRDLELNPIKTDGVKLKNPKGAINVR